MTFALTASERHLLQRVVDQERDQRVVRRARALLDLDQGYSPVVVAARYRVARSTVYNWMDRWRSRGLSEAALTDRPRPGRPKAADGRC